MTGSENTVFLVVRHSFPEQRPAFRQKLADQLAPRWGVQSVLSAIADDVARLIDETDTVIAREYVFNIGANDT